MIIEILKAVSELIKSLSELLKGSSASLVIAVIIATAVVVLLLLSHFIIYPPTLRLNFREQKRRDRIEYISKLLERHTMLEDTNIAVLNEELNKLVFQSASGIEAKSFKRSSLKNLYDATPSIFRWPLIKAANSSLEEQNGKLVKGVSKVDLIFGIASAAAGVIVMLAGLFLFLSSLALRTQLSAWFALFVATVGLTAILIGSTSIVIYATPVLWAWKLQKWVPEKSKTENDESVVID